MKSILLLLTLAMGVGVAHADDDPDPIESLHDEGSQDLRWLADRVDYLLGGTRTDDNKSSSTIRVGLSDSTSRFTPQHDPHLSFKFILKPGLLQRWQRNVQNWFRSEKEHLLEETKAAAQSTMGPIDLRKSKAAVVSSVAPEKDPWQFSLDKRLIIARRVNYWFHARARKEIETKHLLHSFSTEAGWSRSQKWRAITGLSSSHRLAKRWALTFGNEAVWAISEKSFSTSHGPALTYLPGAHQVASLSAGVSTSVIDSSWGASGYSVSATYRLEVRPDGLYLAAGTSVGFERQHHFASDPGANATLEIVF